MKRIKMSLQNIEGRLSRDEMKKIMAGSDGGWRDKCNLYCSSDANCGGACPKCQNTNAPRPVCLEKN